MKVVVTGATGNVGSAVVRLLSADPVVDEVVGVARRRPDEQLPTVTWQQADVASDDLAPLVDGADAVVHLAWMLRPAHRWEPREATNVVGTQRVFEAAAAAGVGAVVCASSVGTYAPAPKDRPTDESWPHSGVETSTYSRQKAAVEAWLDGFEATHPEVRVARLRPALIFQQAAASEIARIFLGPLVPRTLLRPELLKLLPDVDGLRAQVVHTDDVAEAYRLAVHLPVRGAFNVASDPPVDAPTVARWFGGRTLPLPAPVLRAAVDWSWRARLQPTEAGWIDLARAVPVMDTARARRELGWSPTRSAEQCLRELLAGMVRRSGWPSAPLHPGR